MLDSPRVARWLIAAGLVCALGVRLYVSPDARFGEDVGNAYAKAYDLVNKHEFPLVGGPTTWGGSLALPGYWYLCTPPLLVSDSFRVFFAWGALWGALGCIPFALLLFERYGPRAAVLGTWLSATYPWFVTCGDSPWSPKMALPVVALLLYALHRVVAVPKSRWAIGVPLALAGQAHVYPALPATLLMALAVAVFCRPRVNWSWLALGIVLSAATAVPTLVHLAREDQSERPTKGFLTRQRPFNRANSALHSVEDGLLYGTAAGRYAGFSKSALAFQTKHPFRDLYRGALEAYRSAPLVVFAIASVLLALFAWGRAGVLGARNVWSRPSKSWDPMAVAFVAGLIGCAIVAALGMRMHMSRYNCFYVWCGALPTVWLLGGERPLGHPVARVALTAFLIASFAVSVVITTRVYAYDLAPHGAETALQSIDLIVQRQAGRPFVLQVPSWQSQGWNLVAERRHGRKWNRTIRRAADVYSVATLPLSKGNRAALKVRGARMWKVRYGALIRMPASHYPPRARRTAPAARPAPQAGPD